MHLLYKRKSFLLLYSLLLINFDHLFLNCHLNNIKGHFN
ncbi:hypothetical protein BGAPBR_D0014 (plasmid) [Borreliella garinii PBr]|uniref:Uncharacterized protein n=1 Tax=Borreliella garinii PBr TaxID=498743 RepID=B8F1R2_BORGR|nr:hypothetical protein BGAPBR_D0014 [Borreliella garinii PBr]